MIQLNMILHYLDWVFLKNFKELGFSETLNYKFMFSNFYWKICQLQNFK